MNKDVVNKDVQKAYEAGFKRGFEAGKIYAKQEFNDRLEAGINDTLKMYACLKEVEN